MKYMQEIVMDMNSMIGHQNKEILKHMVENTQGYTEKMKCDLKGIIDTSKSPEELFQAVLLYFSGLKWS